MFQETHSAKMHRHLTEYSDTIIIIEKGKNNLPVNVTRILESHEQKGKVNGAPSRVNDNRPEWGCFDPIPSGLHVAYDVNKSRHVPELLVNGLRNLRSKIYSGWNT